MKLAENIMAEGETPLFSDQPADLPYVTVAEVGDIEEGQGKAFPVGKRMVAVFLREGEYFAVDDFCPHQGASLAEGYLTDCGVACPWHHWQFSLADGTWVDNPKISIDKFDVRVMNRKIQVQVPAE
ncbi:MAG: nitrite reductase small subunit NirD [Aureliella sp.]